MLTVNVICVGKLKEKFLTDGVNEYLKRLRPFAKIEIREVPECRTVDEEGKKQLLRLARANDEKVMNTTVIMYNLIQDICMNSSPERGICLSEKFSSQLDEIKDFNIKNIYQYLHQLLIFYHLYLNIYH